jgi:SNF2 family DNA or RNA helicase
MFSGKFLLLDDMLPEMRDNGDRVLIFSQVGTF